MRCPNCNSEKIQFTTNTSSSGFSAGKGCCGYIALGPLGLLCGACGSKTTTDEFWICSNCGYKFETYEAIEEENRIIEEKNKIKERKAIYNSYKEEIKDVNAAQIETENFLKKCDNVSKQREDYLKTLKKIGGEKGKIAKSLASEITLWFIVSLFGLGVIGLFADFLVGLSFILASFIWVAFYVKNKEKLCKRLCELDSNFHKIDCLYKELDSQKKHYKELKEKIDFINNYKDEDEAKEEE